MVSSFIMTVVFVSKSEELTETIATKEIETQAELLSFRVRNSLDTIATELASLSHLAPVQAAARSRGAGPDDKQLPSPAKRRKEVTRIFAAIMEDRPHYSQMRILANMPGGLAGQKISILMSKAAAEKHDHFLRAYQDPQVRRIDWDKRAGTGKRKSGETFPIEIVVTEITMGDEVLFVGILRDVSERRAVDRNSKRLLELVEDVLDFESYSSGMLRLRREDFTLDELLSEAADMVAIRANPAEVMVTVEAPGVPVQLGGDKKTATGAHQPADQRHQILGQWP